MYSESLRRHQKYIINYNLYFTRACESGRTSSSNMEPQNTLAAIAVRSDKYNMPSAMTAIKINGSIIYSAVQLSQDCYSEAQAQCQAVIALCKQFADIALSAPPPLRIITTSDLLIKQLSGEWKISKESYHYQIFPTVRDGIDLVQAELKRPEQPEEINMLRLLKSLTKKSKA